MAKSGSNARAYCRNGHFLPKRLNDSGDFDAEDHRQFGRHRIVILAHERFEDVDAGGANADQNLASAWNRHREVYELKNFRAAEAAQLDGFHGSPDAGLFRHVGVSPLLIGLTLVGFGTSTPELVASVQAALAGSPGIAVGSNICNILLIIGLVALLHPLGTPRATFQRDGPPGPTGRSASVCSRS